MDEEQIQRMIAELLGKLSKGGVVGGATSLLASPISPGSTSYNTLNQGLLDTGGDDGFLPGAVTNFQDKLNYVSENPNLTDVQKQQIGIVPTDWQKKMQWIRDNPGATDMGYTLGIDGQEVGYNFTGDDLTEQALAAFRTRNNITPNLGGGSDSSNLGFTPNVDAITNLSSDFVGGFDTMDTTRGYGLDTPAQRHSIGEIMGNLNLQEQNKVKMILSNMTQEQQRVFIEGMMNGSINPGGYGVQNEQFLY